MESRVSTLQAEKEDLINLLEEEAGRQDKVCMAVTDSAWLSMGNEARISQ